MSGVPLHALLVHFPIVFGVVLPIVAAFVYWKMHKNAVTSKAWQIVFGVSVAFFATAFFAVLAGNSNAPHVQDHASKSYVLLWMSVALCFLALAGCRKEWKRVRLAFVYISFFNLLPMYLAVGSGAQLTHVQSADQLQQTP